MIDIANLTITGQYNRLVRFIIVCYAVTNDPSRKLHGTSVARLLWYDHNVEFVVGNILC